MKRWLNAVRHAGSRRMLHVVPLSGYSYISCVGMCVPRTRMVYMCSACVCMCAPPRVFSLLCVCKAKARSCANVFTNNGLLQYSSRARTPYA